MQITVKQDWKMDFLLTIVIAILGVIIGYHQGKHIPPNWQEKAMEACMADGMKVYECWERIAK